MKTIQFFKFSKAAPALTIAAVFLGAMRAYADINDPPSPSFALVGHIEKFSLATPGDTFSAATIRVRGIDVTLPKGLLITMPGRYLTAQEIFFGPDLKAPAKAESGLALMDPDPPLAPPPAPQKSPRVPFEAELVGNIVNGAYIAGVARISQGALHIGAGFIQNIEPSTGELRVGAKDGTAGARVRLNDPEGIYGLRNDEGAKASIALDQRFALDPDNSPVHASTGFPVCVPRPGPAPDANCPQTNRPPVGDVNQFRFTCGVAPATGPANTPFVQVPVHGGCDPSRAIPLRKGDYVTYSGMLQADGAGGFIVAAHGLDAELGVYTSPGSEPAYVFIEEAIQGTKGEPYLPPQEETTRFRIVAFTTDPTRNVEVRIIDQGRNDVGFTFSGATGLTPDDVPLGRVTRTWPSKDNARAVRRDAQVNIVGSLHGVTPLGLTSGRYTAPVGEYITPEATSFGNPGFALPASFENLCFLTKGGGNYDSVAVARPIPALTPFPNSGHAQSQLIGPGPRRACDGE